MAQQLPAWLTKALVYLRPLRPATAPVAAGDVRICESSARRCFVLVLRAEEQEALAQITLLGSDTALATDRCPVLPISLTGLPFPVVVTNLLGPVFRHQLLERYASLPVELFETVARAALGDRAGCYPGLRWGLPIAGRNDPRWAAYEGLLVKELQPLCAKAVMAMLGD